MSARTSATDRAFVWSKPSSKGHVHLRTVRWPSRKGDPFLIRQFRRSRPLKRWWWSGPRSLQNATSAVGRDQKGGGRVISEHCWQDSIWHLFEREVNTRNIYCPMILCTPRISNNFWNEHRIRTAEFPVSILSASEPGCHRYRFPRRACDSIILACISDDKKFGEHEVQYQSLRSWMFWSKNKRFKSQWTQLLISPWSSTPSPWLKLQSGEVYNNDAVIANRSTVFSETVFVRLERSVHFGDMMAPLLTS